MNNQPQQDNQAQVNQQQYYHAHNPKLTDEQYKQAIDRRYYGDTISAIASELGISTQALSKRFIKDKIIPAKARSYPVSKILDNIHKPITQDNINIYRNLTSKEIARIIDKMTLFSLKDATNKQIMSVMLYNHLSSMFADIEKGKITNPKTKMDIMNLAMKFLSSNPINSSDAILKNINNYLTDLLKNDNAIATGFNDDTKARQTLDKLDKLDDHIQVLQDKQEDIC
jgi:hypothetical protein